MFIDRLLSDREGSAARNLLLSSMFWSVLGMGAGFQFSPNLVVRPSLSLLAGANQGVDNTIFGLSLSWGVGH